MAQIEVRAFAAPQRHRAALCRLVLNSFLRREKATQPPRNWSALYQQRPAPETGDYFQADWLKPYHQAPARRTMAIYGASDYAVTSNGGVHIVVGIDPENRMYLLDLWRKQTSSEIWIDAKLDLVERWQPREWAAEAGQIKSAVGPLLDKRMQERGVTVVGRTFPSRHDKAVRAQSIRGRMALNGLHVPINAPWYANFRAELLTFPAGKHDDQVDALGLIGQCSTECGAAQTRCLQKTRSHAGPVRASRWTICSISTSAKTSGSGCEGAPSPRPREETRRCPMPTVCAEMKSGPEGPLSCCLSCCLFMRRALSASCATAQAEADPRQQSQDPVVLHRLLGQALRRAFRATDLEFRPRGYPSCEY